MSEFNTHRQVKDILLNLGFSNINELAREYRAKPIYRDSDSSNSLSVKKDTGYFVDYARGIQGPLEKLVQLCLNCSIEDAKKWLESEQGFEIKKRHVFDIPDKVYKTLSQDAFDNVIKDNSYWVNRGIEESVINIFEGGVFESGKMKNRFTFPIYDLNKLDQFRSNCTLYLHGHSAGGTNPSLVEAMFLGVPIFAFDVEYNKVTTENSAEYFKSASCLKNMLDRIDQEKLNLNAKKMHEIASKRYLWKIIASNYDLIL